MSDAPSLLPLYYSRPTAKPVTPLSTGQNTPLSEDLPTDLFDTADRGSSQHSQSSWISLPHVWMSQAKNSSLSLVESFKPTARDLSNRFGTALSLAVSDARFGRNKAWQIGSAIHTGFRQFDHLSPVINNNAKTGLIQAGALIGLTTILPLLGLGDSKNIDQNIKTSYAKLPISARKQRGIAAAASLGVLALRIASNPSTELAGIGAGTLANIITAPLANTAWAPVIGVATFATTEAARLGGSILSDHISRQSQIDAYAHLMDIAPDNSKDHCNNSRNVCDLPWSKAVFPSTHLSFAQQTSFASLPFVKNNGATKSLFSWTGKFAQNQATSIEKQFNDGIRGFFLEVSDNGSLGLRLTHNKYWDFGSFRDGLDRLDKLLEANPRQLITVKISTVGDTRTDTIAAQILSSSLKDKALFHQWPLDYSGHVTEEGELIGDLLAKNKQIIFSKDSSFQQTDFEATQIGGVRCDTMQDGSEPSDSPTTVNAFTTFAYSKTSEATNAKLLDLTRICLQKLNKVGAWINMLAVNDYQTSPVVGIAKDLNGR